MLEVWKDIPGYEALYAASTWGRIKSYAKTRVTPTNGICTYPEKILKPGKRRQGYLLVDLWKDEKRKIFSVHRLVAMTFIPNPNNLSQVCHKDDNPENNCVDNLFWGTQADNMRDMASKNREGNPKRSVVGMLPDGSREYEFESIIEASRQTGTDQGDICNCCLGKRKSAGGLIWKYL